MIDRLRINGLAIRAYHGVMRHEGKVGQTFVLDILVELGNDLHNNTRRNGVSHQSIVRIVRESFCARPYHLIEAAAGAVADALLQSSSQIGTVCVNVHKPHAPIAATFADVGISIERMRTPPSDSPK